LHYVDSYIVHYAGENWIFTGLESKGIDRAYLDKKAGTKKKKWYFCSMHILDVIRHALH
jgi:hypothetical protein